MNVLWVYHGGVVVPVRYVGGGGIVQSAAVVVQVSGMGMESVFPVPGSVATFLD